MPSSEANLATVALVNAEPVIRRIDDVPSQEWRSASRGSVRWWELIGGDTMPTTELVVGIAEVPIGAGKPPRGHAHAPAEVYYVLSGNGELFLDGATYALAPGDAVWIPPHAEHVAYNVGGEPLRLMYVFAKDAFSEIEYCFPGEEERDGSHDTENL